MSGDKKFTIEITVPDRWSQGRTELLRERRSSGRTSIRVSKLTLEQLRAFAAKMAKLGDDADGGYGWYHYDTLKPDELLAIIARGAVRAGHALAAGAGADRGRRGRANSKNGTRRHASPRAAARKKRRAGR